MSHTTSIFNDGPFAAYVSKKYSTGMGTRRTYRAFADQSGTVHLATAGAGCYMWSVCGLKLLDLAEWPRDTPIPTVRAPVTCPKCAKAARAIGIAVEEPKP